MSIISTVGVPVTLIVSGPLEVLAEEIYPPPVQLLLPILNLFDHLDSLEAFIDPLKQGLVTSEKLQLALVETQQPSFRQPHGELPRCKHNRTYCSWTSLRQRDKNLNSTPTIYV